MSVLAWGSVLGLALELEQEPGQELALGQGPALELEQESAPGRHKH